MKILIYRVEITIKNVFFRFYFKLSNLYFYKTLLGNKLFRVFFFKPFLTNKAFNSNSAA